MFQYKTSLYSIVNTIVVLIDDKKKNIIFKNNMCFYKYKIQYIYINGLYLLDCSILTCGNKKKNTLFFSLTTQNTLDRINITLLNIMQFNSFTYKFILSTWYEREVYEKCSIVIKNMFDTRNLLYNYSYRFIQNHMVVKQTYYWTTINFIKKNITVNNKLKIIL